MNIALWIVASLLAIMFFMAGLMKATQPKDKIAQNLPWANDFSAGTVKMIGVLEVLGALGLILPPIFNIATILTPLAATGLAITMLLAIFVHARRKENQAIVTNVVLLALSLFVAIMRFGLYAF